MDTTSSRSTISSGSVSIDNNNSVARNGRYSFSGASSDDSDDEYTGSAAYKNRSKTRANSSDKAHNGIIRDGDESGEQQLSSGNEMFLRDVPMEGQHILPTDYDEGKREETITFYDRDDKSYHSSPPLKSNQEYYDVLQMANHRLSRDTTNRSAIELSQTKSKVKKKKKKSKKKKKLAEAMEKFKTALKQSEGDWEFSTVRDAVDSRLHNISKGLTPQEMKDYSIDDEDNDDPNNQVPRSSIWRPSTLVTLAASKNDEKIDKNGYYKSLHGDGTQKKATTRATAMGVLVDGAATIYRRFQSLMQPEEGGEMKHDFNLQTLTKRNSQVELQSSDGEPRSLQDSTSSRVKTSTRRHLHESIVWGDESTIGPFAEDEETEGIEMHDYSYSDINTASRDYRRASESLVEKMKWRRENRIIGCLLSVGGIFLFVCVILYIIGNYSENGNQSSYSMPPPVIIPSSNATSRKEPPPRPDAKAPRPVDNYSEMSHPITADDLDFVIKKITEDQSILSDLNSPQGKAYAWCKNDLMINKVNNAARLAQRYGLAVLYYATYVGGDRMWKNSTNWLNGHECEWYGIKCEFGEDKVMSGEQFNVFTFNSIETRVS